MNPFKFFVDGIVSLAKLIGHKVKFTDILIMIGSQLLPMIGAAQASLALDTKEKIDAFVGTADSYLGIEPGALDVVRDMTKEAEEEATDGLLKFVRAVLYTKAGVSGYKEGV